MRRRLLTACLALASSIAWADGGFFPVLAGSARSADQRAVLIHADGRETLVLQTAHHGDGNGFAWVVPTPTQVQRADVAEGDAQIFDELFWMTEPRTHVYGGWGGFGCGGGGSSAGGEQYAGVNVWDTFTVANYDVAVLSAADSGHLGAWLNTNGYRVPDGADDELGHYVSKGWFFVALKLAGSPDGDAWAGAQAGERPMRPLQITFDAPQIIFPMRISAVSSETPVEVLLYVLSDHRVQGDNYATVTVDVGPDWDGGDFAAYYRRKFREALARVGPRGLVEEYAGWVERWSLNTLAQYAPMPSRDRLFLTRLKTVLDPEDMTEDVVLVRAGSDVPFRVSLGGMAAARPSGGLALAGLLALGVLVLARSNGRTPGACRGLLALVALVCTLL